MTTLLLALACTGATDDSAEPEETFAAPTISWLTPAADTTVTAGEVPCSLVVDNFTLEDPAKHPEGAPTGYVAVTAGSDAPILEGSTNFTLTLAAGTVTLSAQLFYLDGDEVSATPTELCDEDDTDTACAPVASEITVTVE